MDGASLAGWGEGEGRMANGRLGLTNLGRATNDVSGNGSLREIVWVFGNRDIVGILQVAGLIRGRIAVEGMGSGVPAAERAAMKTLQETIREHPFLTGMRPDHQELLMPGAVESRFAPGEILFREGEPANRFYLILEGVVAIEAHRPADGDMVVQYVGAGDVLGWSWLFPPFSWHFQARALDSVHAVVLNGGRLLVTAEHDRDFGYELMKRVSRILIHRLQMTRHRLLEQTVESACVP